MITQYDPPIPETYAEVLALYGPPSPHEKLVAVALPAPIGAVMVMHAHPLAAPSLARIFQAIHDFGSWGTLRSFDGCFCFRSVRGNPNRLSMHSFGIAVDLNAHDNPLGVRVDGATDNPYIFHSQHPVVLAFQREGWWWGGDFANRADSMHFERARDV